MIRRLMTLVLMLLAGASLLVPSSKAKVRSVPVRGMDREAKRLDVTIEAVKQQIALASGIIAAVVALANKRDPIWAVLPYALTPLAGSVIGGVFALLAIPYALYGDDDPFHAVAVRVAGTLQAVLFCLGIVIMVWLVAQETWHYVPQNPAPAADG